MARVTLNTLGNLNTPAAVAALNENFQRLSEALDKTVSRLAEAPDAMEARLDMGNQRLINLPAPTTNTEPLRKGDIDVLELRTLRDTVLAKSQEATDAASAASVALANATIRAAQALDSQVQAALEADRSEAARILAEAAAQFASDSLAILQGYADQASNSAATAVAAASGVAADALRAENAAADAEADRLQVANNRVIVEANAASASASKDAAQLAAAQASGFSDSAQVDAATASAAAASADADAAAALANKLATDTNRIQSEASAVRAEGAADAAEISETNAAFHKDSAQASAATATNASATAVANANQTAADRVQTGLDRSAVAADKAVVASNTTTTTTARDQAVAAATTSTTNAEQTASDRAAVAADKITVETAKTETLGYRDQAAIDAANADADAASALASRNAALGFRNEAEGFADSAAGTAKIFADTATGLANTNGTGATNRYFAVPTATSTSYLTLYRNDAGVAVTIATYPNKLALDKVLDTMVFALPPGYQYAITDSKDNAAFLIKDDGSILVTEMEASVFSTADSEAKVVTNNMFDWYLQDQFGNVAIGVKKDGTFYAYALETTINVGEETGPTVYTELEFVNTLLDEKPKSGNAYQISDSADKVAFSIKDDGTVVIPYLEVEDLTVTGTSNIGGTGTGGVEVANTVPQRYYDSDVNGFFIYGHSGTVGYGQNAVSTTAIYDSVKFNGGARPQDLNGDADPAAAHASFQPLVESNANYDLINHGETQCWSMTAFLKYLIQKEDGISHTAQKYQLLSAAPGKSGATMLELNVNPLIGRMNNAISYGTSLSNAGGFVYKTQAVALQMGENDESQTTSTGSNFKERYISVVNSIESQSMVATNTKPVFFSVQSASHRQHNADPQKRATWAYQLIELADENPGRIYLGFPNYMFPRNPGDLLHYSAVGVMWMGAYLGLMYKKIVIDKTGWKCLRPLVYTRQANILEIKFDVPYKPLVIDTTLVTQTPNFGFEILNEAGVSQTISSVTIIREDTVKIVCAVPIQAGWKVRHAYNSTAANQDTTGPESGPRSNIRDSMGDTYVAFPTADFPTGINRRLDNWAILFEQTLT